MATELIQKELRKYASKKRALVSRRFFKTGKGQYGEGDIFVGVSNPDARKAAKMFVHASFSDIRALLESSVHEDRFVALEILVAQYENAKKKNETKVRKSIVDFYLAHTDRVNNWDLVDTSAPYLLGDYLRKKSKSILYRLVQSKKLWERRIAVVSTLGLIQVHMYTDTLKLVYILRNDREDLIHKACGWMLREVGKRDKLTLVNFLDTHGSSIPRTTLRYAIERLSLKQRKRYMGKK